MFFTHKTWKTFCDSSCSGHSGLQSLCNSVSFVYIQPFLACLNTNFSKWLYWDLFCLFDFILYVPVNDLSVMSRHVFLGWTSTKLGLMCLAQGHKAVMPVRLEPTAPRSRIKHSTTEPLHSLFIVVYRTHVLHRQLLSSDDNLFYFPEPILTKLHRVVLWATLQLKLKKIIISS